MTFTRGDLTLFRSFIESEITQLTTRIWDLDRNAYRNGESLTVCVKLLDQRHRTLSRINAALIREDDTWASSTK
jgi:hypothetical protein